MPCAREFLRRISVGEPGKGRGFALQNEDIAGIAGYVGCGAVRDSAANEELVAALDRLTVDSSYQRELGLAAHSAFQKKWTTEAHLQRYFWLIDEVAAARDLPIDLNSVKQESHVFRDGEALDNHQNITN